MKAIRRNARRQINAMLDDAALIRFAFNGNGIDGQDYRRLTANEAREMMARHGVDCIWDSETGCVTITLDHGATIDAHATIDNALSTMLPRKAATCKKRLQVQLQRTTATNGATDMKIELTTEQRNAIKTAARNAGVKIDDTRIAGNPRRTPIERLYAAAGIRINGGEPVNADRHLPGGLTIGEVLTVAGI